MTETPLINIGYFFLFDVIISNLFDYISIRTDAERFI